MLTSEVALQLTEILIKSYLDVKQINYKCLIKLYNWLAIIPLVKCPLLIIILFIHCVRYGSSPVAF